jgi:hypothetical protein
MQTTAGQVDDSQPSVLRWSGAMTDINQVDITYRVLVTQQSPEGIISTVTLNAGKAGQYNFQNMLIANGLSLFIPTVRK